MVELTKIEAAKRQINCAVQLFFSEVDPVAVHTLVGAASNILFDLNEKKSDGASFESSMSEVTGLSLSETLKVVRRPQNFLKHAKNDHLESIDFDPMETEELMFIVARNLASLNGNNEKISIELSVFELWYLAVREPFDDEAVELMRQVHSVFPNVSSLGRPEQLKRGRQVLNQWVGS